MVLPAGADSGASTSEQGQPFHRSNVNLDLTLAPPTVDDQPAPPVVGGQQAPVVADGFPERGEGRRSQRQRPIGITAFLVETPGIQAETSVALFLLPMN